MIGLPPLYHIFGWSSVFTVAPVLGSTTYLLQKVSIFFSSSLTTVNELMVIGTPQV